MTLEELRLRVLAAFPDATVWCPPISDHLVVCCFEEPFDLCLGTRLMGHFVASMDRADIHVSIGFAGDRSSIRCHELARPEVVRRILSVSAHALLAARRRMPAAV